MEIRIVRYPKSICPRSKTRHVWETVVNALHVLTMLVPTRQCESSRYEKASVLLEGGETIVISEKNLCPPV